MAEMCEGCEAREGRSQVCAADGRYHHHGCMHTYDGGLKWLCDDCATIDRENWRARKLLGEIERSATA